MKSFVLVLGNIRVLMRRDKTLKICANHLVQPWMQLRPNCGSERAFVWSVQAEFADGEPKPELLAIKFANAEYAKKFKAKVRVQTSADYSARQTFLHHCYCSSKTPSSW